MATRINSRESESNLHDCFRCFVPMRALQFVLESLANRACCLLRAADTRSRIALEGPPTVRSPYHGTQSMALRCGDRSDRATVRKCAADIVAPDSDRSGTHVSNRQNNRTDTGSSPPPA